MANRAKLIFLLNTIVAVVSADDKIYFNEEDERRWNTPPELTPEQIDPKLITNGQTSLFPLSASFVLNAAQSNAHSLSVGANENGINLSQSSSHASSNANSYGNSGSSLSTSQSLSFTASVNGISASNANSFALNNPTFGSNSQANSNSFGIGHASSSAHGSATSGQSMSVAQSSAGPGLSTSISASSSSIGNTQNNAPSHNKPQWTNLQPDHEHRGPYRPKLTITQESGPEPNRPVGTIRFEIRPEDKRWMNQRQRVRISKWHPRHELHLANSEHQ